MKKLSLILLLLTLSSYSIDNQVKPSIVFIITKTAPYCGGANRSEKEIDKIVKKKLARQETFYIIKGKKNLLNRKIVKSFTMGLTNSGFIHLSPGTYSVINKFSYQKLVVDPNKFDITCMQEHWETPLFSFTISKIKSDTIVYNIALPCEYNKPCAKLNNDIPM